MATMSNQDTEYASVMPTKFGRPACTRREHPQLDLTGVRDAEKMRGTRRKAINGGLRGTTQEETDREPIRETFLRDHQIGRMGESCLLVSSCVGNRRSL